MTDKERSTSKRNTERSSSTDKRSTSKSTSKRSTSRAPTAKLRPRPLKASEPEPLPVVSPSLTVASLPVSSTSSNGAIEFFYKPHHLSGLFLLIGYLLKVAFYDESPTRGSIIRGVSVAAGCFVFISALLIRDGPFIRPHPLFWRLIQSLSLLYLLLMIFFLFQPLQLARQIVGLMDGSLGRPLEEKSYAVDCSLTWENVKGQMDFFIFAHVAGWWAKTIILRDVWLCWILSVMFEACEYSLQHQLPNFAECWWDHWILDVATCNLLGIWMGMRTIRWLSMKTYNWRSIRRTSTVIDKLHRSVAQFTPHSWTPFDWAATKSFKGFAVVVILCTLLLASEVAGFYLKYLLWIPPPHPSYSLRSILYAFAGCAGVRELYQYCTDPLCQTIGAQAWILAATVIVEWLVIAKWSVGMFTEPFPTAVKVFWVGLGAGLVIFPIWKFYLCREREE